MDDTTYFLLIMYFACTPFIIYIYMDRASKKHREEIRKNPDNSDEAKRLISQYNIYDESDLVMAFVVANLIMFAFAFIYRIFS